MHNCYALVALLLAVLTPLMSLSAQSDCDCTVTATSKNGKKLAYSGNCDNLQPGCTLTIKSGVKNADFSRFTDLSGVTVIMESKVKNPTFLGTSLSNNTTSFNFQDDPGTTLKIIDPRGKTVTYSDNRGRGGYNVDRYNEALAACPGTCDLNNPSTPISGLALPVTLLSWEATAGAETVLLDWQTANESDNDYFRILHSTNGVDFSPIAEVLGQGNTESLSTYRYAHAEAAAGVNYYQLEQIDFDGTVTVLGVRSAQWKEGGDAGAKLAVYPNPVVQGATLSIRGTDDRQFDGTASLLSLTGRVMGDLPLGPNGQLTVPTGLTAGIYLLRVGKHTTRLVVRP